MRSSSAGFVGVVEDTTGAGVGRDASTGCGFVAVITEGRLVANVDGVGREAAGGGGGAARGVIVGSVSQVSEATPTLTARAGVGRGAEGTIGLDAGAASRRSAAISTLPTGV